jgi:hypothetical protein
MHRHLPMNRDKRYGKRQSYDNIGSDEKSDSVLKVGFCSSTPVMACLTGLALPVVLLSHHFLL